MFSKLAGILGLAALASASPILNLNPKYTPDTSTNELSIEKRADCNNPPRGLSKDDCNYLNNIGSQVGVNSYGNNGKAWIGNDGRSTINVKNVNNNPRAPIIVVVWGPGGSWVNANQPLVTYTLQNPGDSVTISLADSFSGALAGIYDHRTILKDGQVFNTWAEFTSQGQFTTGTINVSRLPNMGGNPLEFWTPGAACHGSMTECAYVCKSGNRCGYGDGETNLLNCQGSNKNGYFDGTNWHGGCNGWNYGLVNVQMSN